MEDNLSILVDGSLCRRHIKAKHFLRDLPVDAHIQTKRSGDALHIHRVTNFNRGWHGVMVGNIGTVRNEFSGQGIALRHYNVCGVSGNLLSGCFIYKRSADFHVNAVQRVTQRFD